MLVSLTIPTLKSEKEVEPLIQEIRNCLPFNPGYEYEIMASCIPQSASKNRNWCIDNSKGDIIIQMDDDTSVIQKDWIAQLLNPFVAHHNYISIIAPKLTDFNFNPVGQLGDGGWYDFNGNPSLKVAVHTPKTNLNIVCSACIAFFRDNDVRFDENYPAASYEDSDFCMETNKKFPNKKIVINLNSKIQHASECKWKCNKEHLFNKSYFSTKQGVTL